MKKNKHAPKRQANMLDALLFLTLFVVFGFSALVEYYKDSGFWQVALVATVAIFSLAFLVHITVQLIADEKAKNGK
jgi:hypothetical protein